MGTVGMPWRALQLTPSTNIASARYDEQATELEIQFQRQARTYTYHQVPADVIAAWERAESSGKFFLRRVKDQYTYEETG